MYVKRNSGRVAEQLLSCKSDKYDVLLSVSVSVSVCVCVLGHVSECMRVGLCRYTGAGVYFRACSFTYPTCKAQPPYFLGLPLLHHIFNIIS